MRSIFTFTKKGGLFRLRPLVIAIDRASAVFLLLRARVVRLRHAQNPTLEFPNSLILGR